MAKPRHISADPSGRGELRRHRLVILAALLEICRKFEQLPSSTEARQACQEVAAMLHAALTQEQASVESRRR